ncbi:ATP-dependent Zn protease [Candidatus Phytoplasma luffae]|uniref:ATP-dependent Zn protease n=1 Tax=Loofah witches'-broom phytoplasma TaxID=35773 RepID=A0A975FKF2_LOWBP|nr:AAA family ATPase [Candidatus Phytoplasma luffae]QTX03058.1 ATP-dependent Zn protease [Candidatus Phytoplasma luffae]
MTIKIKILSNFIFILIIFYSPLYNKIYLYGEKISEELEQESNSIKRLKFIFPKLNNNPELLKKVLEEITKEFDNPIYYKESKKNIKEKIHLLDRYNIINEFPDVFEQTVYDINNFVFVFIADKVDFTNYEKYLQHKKNNFDSNLGFFWKNWQPSNTEFISKSKINFLINVFEEIMILEKELNIQKNINVNDQIIKQLKNKIKEYDDLLQTQENNITEKTKEIEQLKLEILNKNIDFKQLNQEIQTKNNFLKKYEEKLKEHQILSQEEKNLLQNNIDKINKELKLLYQKLQEQELFLNSKEQKIKDISIELKIKFQEIEEIKEFNQKEKNFLQESIKNKIENINELKKIINDFEQKIGKLHNNLEHYKTKLQMQEEKINNLEINSKRKENEIYSLKQDINSKNIELNKKKQELQNQKQGFMFFQNKLKNEISQLQIDIQYFQNKLMRKEIILNSNNEEINDLKEKLKDKQKEIIQIKTLNQQEKEILNRKLEENISKIKKIEQFLAHNQQEIKEIKETILIQENIIKQKQFQIEQIKDNIEIKKNIIFSLNRQINSFKEEIENKQKEIDENKILSETEKKNLQREIEINKININTLIEQIQTKEDNLTEYKQEIFSLSNALKNKKEEIEQIIQMNELEKNKLKNIIDNQISQLKINSDQLKLLQDEIDKLNEKIENQNIIIAKKEQKINNLKDKIKNNNIEISSLSKKIEQTEKQLKLNAEELLKNKNLSETEKNNLNQEIKELEAKIKKLQDDISLKSDNLNKLQEENELLGIDLNKQKDKLKQNQILNEHEKTLLESKIDRTLHSLEQNQFDLKEYKNKIENSLKDNTLFTRLVLESMRNIGDMNKEVFRFIHEINSKQENKKINNNLLDSFVQKTDKFPNFKDVIGSEVAVQQLKESLTHLKNTELYKKMGNSKSPKGVLLYGPPGTGKTFLAKVFAKEAGLPFFAVSSDDFSRKYVGEAPQLIKKLFEEARKNAPSIVLIDECEVAFRKRNSDGLNSDHGNVITAFLSQIEGIQTDPKKPVFVIGTTNFKDEIDDSILSRFNKLIEIGLWSEKDLNMFFKTLSKKYKLDLRAYKYLDILTQMIVDSNLDYLRTARKLIELLEQSAVIATNQHKHLNILPIDLETVLKRIIDPQSKINWENHKHEKHNRNELFDITEYKNIAIEHIFKDSEELDKRKGFFSLIKEKYDVHKKFVYNINNKNEFSEVEISKDGLEQIKNFYSSENPIPEGLIGFYFENIQKNEQNKSIKSISSIEDILDEAVKTKDQKIYFIWDIEKIKQNKIMIDDIVNKYQNMYSFLKYDYVFNDQISQMHSQIAINKEGITKEIIKYIDDIKKRLFFDVNSYLTKINNLADSENNLYIENKIKTKIEEILNSNTFINFEQIKNKIIHDMEQSLNQNLESSLKEKIDFYIQKINLNEEIFSKTEIEQLKDKIKEDTEKNLIMFKNFSLKQIKEKIKEIENKYNDEIFQKKWKNIIDKININFHLEKDKIVVYLENKTKKELFYQNLNLEEIVDTLNRESQNQIEKIKNNLNKKILNNIQNYILIDNILGSDFINEDIELINKGAILMVQNELKKEKISEEEIDNKILSFVKNYKIKNKTTDKYDHLYSWIKNNFYWLQYVLIIILFKFFMKKNKRKYKK